MPHIDKFGFVKECLIYYVQRNNSIVNTQNERTKEIFEVLDNVITYYKDNNFYEEYKIELEYTYTRLLLCSSFLRIIKIKNSLIRKEQLKNTWENLNYNFPEWKNNEILKEVKSLKNKYMKSVNSITFKLYSVLLRMFKL